MRRALVSVADSRSPAMGPADTAENDEEEESDNNTDATANGGGGGAAAAANGKRKQQRPHQAREEVFALSNTEDNESLQGLVRSRGSLWIGKFGLPSPPAGEDESEVRERRQTSGCMGQVNGTERTRFFHGLGDWGWHIFVRVALTGAVGFAWACERRPPSSRRPTRLPCCWQGRVQCFPFPLLTPGV